MGDYEMIYVSGAERSHDQIVDNILCNLPRSFNKEVKWRAHNSHQIAENGLLSVCTADNEWSEAVFVCPNEYVLDGHPELLNLAYRHLPNVMKHIKKGLRQYELRVRCGPWTSGRIPALELESL